MRPSLRYQTNPIRYEGLIEQTEMVEILTSLQTTEGISPDCSETFYKIFRTLDGNGDGQISEEEFIKTFLKIVHFEKFLKKFSNLNAQDLDLGAKQGKRSEERKQLKPKKAGMDRVGCNL